MLLTNIKQLQNETNGLEIILNYFLNHQETNWSAGKLLQEALLTALFWKTEYCTSNTLTEFVLNINDNGKLWHEVMNLGKKLSTINQEKNSIKVMSN